MFRFDKRYFALAVLLFIIEVYIAMYVRDSFIRPYVGDFLVVLLLYCLLRSFIKVSMRPAALGVLAFAFILETLQYFRIDKLLGLPHSSVAAIVIGSAFAWEDLLAYTLGIAFVWLAEYFFNNKK